MFTVFLKTTNYTNVIFGTRLQAVKGQRSSNFSQTLDVLNLHFQGHMFGFSQICCITRKRLDQED